MPKIKDLLKENLLLEAIEELGKRIEKGLKTLEEDEELQAIQNEVISLHQKLNNINKDRDNGVFEESKYDILNESIQKRILKLEKRIDYTVDKVKSFSPTIFQEELISGSSTYSSSTHLYIQIKLDGNNFSGSIYLKNPKNVFFLKKIHK